MDNNRTYSIADLSRELKRPRSTVSYWLETFDSYFTAHIVGSGRTKRFKGEALEVLRIIERMKDQNSPNEEVERILNESGAPVVIDEEQTHEVGFFNELADSYKAVLELMQAQEERFEARLKEMSENHEKELRAAREESQKVAESMERIEKAQAERDRKLMESLRDLQEQKKAEKEALEQKQKSGFLKRLFQN